MLLEGKFTSFFKNKIAQSQLDTIASHGGVFKDFSSDNKMIVVGDGDIVLNDLVPGNGPNTQPVPIPMGFNKYTYTEYLKQSNYSRFFVPVANREFLLSCIENLTNDAAISETRNKDTVLRLLNSEKVKDQKTTWQLINIALPVLLVIIFGWVYQQIRKRKYAA